MQEGGLEMGIREVIRRSFVEGYATGSLEIDAVFVCILCTAAIAVYIYMVYKCINKNSFYNRNFNLSLIAIAIVTSAVILTIQSNIVVSLGMVGALSIVRFRTAIKDPMDLFFLFWSISVGICHDCCGCFFCADCYDRRIFSAAGVQEVATVGGECVLLSG